MVDSEATVRVLVHKGGVACFGKHWRCAFFCTCVGMVSGTFKLVAQWGLKISLEGTGRDHEGSISRLTL